jgi:uncharacterized membrane protein YphA (DoxX/SURF4 family)
MMIPSVAAPPLAESRLYRLCMLIARLGLAYLFFTQLWWKLPPQFGCGEDFAFPQPAADNYWSASGSSGLCYWMGLESIFASQDRRVLIADMRPAGLPDFGVNIKPLAQVNGWLLDSIVIPNIRLFGWLIWLAEFWVFLSMLLGLFTRAGALVAIGVMGQLWLGLANIPRPFEWEWSYGAILLLAVALLGAAPGRWAGLDAWLRPRLAGPAARGNVLARIALALT